MDRGFLRLLDYWTEGACRFEEAVVRCENLRSGLREVLVDPHCDGILARGLDELSVPHDPSSDGIRP
jgi:hypothetical protein